MSSDLALIGAKAAGGTYRNRPDNLRSTDTFEALIGLTSSRARLAPGGLNNLYLDDVPVEDGQGNASFTDFAAFLFDGDPTVLAPIKLQLGSSGGQNNIGLTLSNSYTNGAPGEWVNAAVTQPNVDFIDLRFVVQQLYSQTKKGVTDATATIEIELRPSGLSQWVNPLLDISSPVYNRNGIPSFLPDTTLEYLIQNRFNEVGGTWQEDYPGKLRITGKTTSAYVKELRLAVPNEGAYANRTWQIRARLVERDYVVSGTNGENEDRRTIQWESVAGVSTAPIGNTEEWRGLSYLRIYGKATDQISGLPEVTGIYDIGQYAVPPSTVWDPTTRLYTGAAWDGVTSQIAWTQCPAWQIKGLIEDDLSGVSALTPGSIMNKWDVLEASRWFSQLVPDGKGGTHPRYSGNWFIENQMQINELVNYLGGAVGAFCWDEGDGRWRMKVEKPDTPSMIFTKENIVGEFVYSHTDFDSRFNDMIGVYRDRENRYEESRVRVFDQPDIDNTGRRHTTIALVGCDNRQEALRRLKIRLLTSLKETRMVSFTTNRQGALLEQFSIIGIADGDLNASASIRSTGRITGVVGNTVSVRDPLRLEVGVSYKAHVTIPNPDYDPETTSQPSSSDWRKPTITISRNVVNTNAQRGDITNLVLDQALPPNLPEFAPIALEAVGLPALPKQYRVMNVQMDDGGEQVTITAIEVYTSKWLESDNVSESEILSQMVNRTVPPATAPAGGAFQLKTFLSEYETKRQLSLNWVRPGSMFLDGYRLELRFNGGPWQQLGRTRDTFYEMQEPQPGTYDFQIYVIDRRGKESVPLLATYEFSELLALPPAAGLTNETANVAADKTGSVSSFADCGGTFWLATQLGFVTSDIIFRVKPGSATGGLNISINASGVYTITGLTSDQGSAILEAEWNGFTIDKVYNLTKSRAGADGSAPPLITLTGSSQQFKFDKDGAAVSQTITFSALRSAAATAATVWTIRNKNNVTIVTGDASAIATTGFFSRTDNDNISMTHTQFVSFINGSPDRETFSVEAKSGAVSDRWSVTKVQDGASGAGNYTLVNKANCTLTPNSIEKTSSVWDWDASAHSLQGYSGDVLVSGVVANASAALMIGLNTDPNTDASYGSLDYAAYCNGGNLEIWESSAYRGTIGTVASGDTMFVRRRGTTVEYGVNGIIRYTTNGVSKTSVLFLDTSIATPGGKFQNIVLTPVGSDGANAFRMVNVANTTIEPGLVIKTSTANWDGKARTEVAYANGASITCDYQTSIFVGLTTDPTNGTSYDTIDYSIYISGSNQTYIVCNNAFIYVGVLPAGKLIVSSDNRTVRYYQNGALIYSHAVNTPGEILYGVCELYYQNAALTGLGFSAAGAAGDDGRALDVSATNISVSADYIGNVKTSQLPKATRAKYTIGNSDVSGATSWSVGAIAGCSVSIDSSGLATVTDVTGNGSFTVTGTYQGIPISKTISINLNKDPAPPPTATSEAVRSFNVSSSSTFPTPTQGIVTVGTNSAGALSVSMLVTFNTNQNGSTNNSNLQAKAVFRLAGSGAAFSDLTTTYNGTASTYSYNAGEPILNEGRVNFQATTSGLAQNTAFEVAIVIRNIGFSAAVGIAGSATVSA